MCVCSRITTFLLGEVLAQVECGEVLTQVECCE